MANINVTVTDPTINVSETVSNITVTDVESNAIVSNITTIQSNVTVTSAQSNVIVSEVGGSSNAEIRAAISNVSPILYNNTTGVISIDESALFSGKTTDDLAEGNTNLYYSNARVDARVPTTILNGNITLKQFNETIYNAGNIQGSVTFDISQGTLQRATLVGNVSNISFTNAGIGSTVTLILQQDAIGNWTIPNNSVLTNWQFAGNVQTINNAPLSNTYLSVIKEDGYFKASIVKFSGDLGINLSGNTTDDLAEGSSNLYFTTARARQSISGTGDISYDSNTGVISYIGTPGDITDVIAGSGLTGGGSSGNVTLNVGAGTGITVNADNIAVNMSAFTTTDLVEGSNLYYTTDRANTAIGAYQGSINTTGNVTAGYFIGNGSQLTGVTSLTNAQVVAYIATQPLTVGGNLDVNGNINATGNINYQNVTDLYVTDQKITLNSNAATNSNVEIISNRPTATNVMLKWNEQATRWEFTNNGTTYYPIPTSTTDLAEGSNLWFTTARANSAMDSYLIGGTGISYTSGTIALDFTEFSTSNIAEGSNLWFSNARVNSFIQDNITTTDIDEGTRLYYTSDRANTAIGAYQGSINTAGNITAGYFFGNGSQLTGVTSYTDSNVNALLSGGTLTSNIRTSGNIIGAYLYGDGSNITGLAGAGTVTQVNTGENLTGGPITSTGTIGMANTLANVNGVSSETAANLTLTTNKQITVTTRQRNNDLTNSANIYGEGFALSQTTNLTTAPFFTYSGTEQLKTIGINGNATLGSNVITVTSLRDMQNNPLTISNVTPYMAFTDFPTLAGGTTIFPPGTYVVSASGSNIFMSANCIDTEPLNFDPANPYTNSFGGLSPGAYDATTGLLVALESNFDGGGANAQLIDVNFLNNLDLKYGYGPNGPIPSNFVYSIGTSSDYSINTSVISNFMFGRTDFSADQTVANFRRGVTIGDADLTNRGENDGIQTFGLNIVWDGTANSLTDYGTSSGIFPQILLKQYTTGTNQATSLTNSGPRMLFIGANGKNTDAPLTTYARNNQELGRISWLSTTATSATPSSVGPPAYISVVANRDQTNGPGGIGMYLVAAPTDNSMGTVNAVGGVTARQLWAAAHKGNTIISAGAPFNNNSGNVIFAPARQGLAEGNAVLLAQRIVDSACASPHWSTIGYDVPTSNTGARISVTNGHNTTAGRNGNLSVALNRRDNGAGFGTKEWALKIRSGQTDLVLTEDGAIRTTFAGANITTSGNVSASTFLGNISGATGTFTGNITAGNTIVNGVSFNTAGTTSPSSGQIVYNSNYGTHQVGLNGSNVMLMGQDLVVYARNAEANTLVKGEVVRISGASGDKATVSRAINNSDANSATSIGIVKQDIAAGQLGYIVSQGVVDGINLGAYTAGDLLYLGNVAGTFTNVKPSAPQHIVFIGVVERANAGNGQIFVRVQNGFELDEIHDVQITSLQANDMLIRNTGNTLWINQNFGTTVTNSNITLKQFQETRVDLGTTNGNITLDMANGSIFAMTANGNISNIALSNAGVGASGTLIITQDGTGSRLLTVTSAWKFAGASKTLSTAANTIDIVNFFTDGTTIFAALSKGYA